MKKHFIGIASAWLLMILLLALLLPTQGLAAGGTVSSNANGQNYSTWARQPHSYLYPNDDDTYTRLEYLGNSKIVAELYDIDFNLISTREIPMELSLFGGFHSGENYNFIVFGQTNHSQNNSLEVFRVVKYSKDWQRLGDAGLSNCNTTVPFDAGSLRIAEYGDMLYIRSSHEMYKSRDGRNHQANITFSVSVPDMRVTDGYWGVGYISFGYVSHSFNQFILTSGSTLAAVDHGDAHPRSIVLLVYSAPAGSAQFIRGSSASAVTLLAIPGATGANRTGASIGGFEASRSSYLVAGNSVAHDNRFNSNQTRNIFVAVAPLNRPANANIQVKWLTNYAENGNTVTSTPHMVKVNNNTFVVLWSEGDIVKYVAIDGNGNTKSREMSMSGALSDVMPIAANDKVIWYVTNNSEPVFYSIGFEEFMIPQSIAVSGLTGKTYGDEPFSLTVTPDSSSQLSKFTFASDNAEVAEIDKNGQITINGVGTAAITVREPGDDDYAPFVWTRQLSVSMATAEVEATPVPLSTHELANAAVEEKAEAAEGLSIRIEQAGPAMTIDIGSDAPTMAIVSALPEVDVTEVAAMAILGDDGRLLPVPTMVSDDETITVVISGEQTLVPLSVASDFNDVAGHWGMEWIERAASLMIIEGRGEGAFRPSNTVTNAETTTIFLRAFGIATNAEAPPLEGIDQAGWYAPYLNTAAQRGWISVGIVPGAPITRVEIAGLIVNALNDLGLGASIPSTEVEPILAQFRDLGGLTEQERERMAICVRLGIFMGNGDGTLGARGVLTRAHMAVLAVRLQSRIFGE